MKNPSVQYRYSLNTLYIRSWSISYRLMLFIFIFR
ncbi:unnamed protein product [Amoebophrya sp. A120]|nr:unnamed protein product [Amoebophrya sp. A120]|eukprot:GSA120T00011277001.1